MHTDIFAFLDAVGRNLPLALPAAAEVETTQGQLFGQSGQNGDSFNAMRTKPMHVDNTAVWLDLTVAENSGLEFLPVFVDREMIIKSKMAAFDSFIF